MRTLRLLTRALIIILVASLSARPLVRTADPMERGLTGRVRCADRLRLADMMIKAPERL
jgi:hypothetical protein